MLRGKSINKSTITDVFFDEASGTCLHSLGTAVSSEGAGSGVGDGGADKGACLADRQIGYRVKRHRSNQAALLNTVFGFSVKDLHIRTSVS